MLPSLLDAAIPNPLRRAPSYQIGTTYGFFPPVHLVYVHGFRGDHTSFQRFPTDLHYSLEDRIPSLSSHVYPTYKSRKPLQVSVDRLLTWLQTLEPGYIILVGHSLGGFVVAEAGLQHKAQPGGSQIIGVIAVDVPYLGVHPHVVVSGIASLFPSDKPPAHEDDLNDTDKVNMVNPSDVASVTTPDSRLSPSSSPSRSPSPSPSGRASPGFKDMSKWKLPDLTPGPTLGQNAAHFFRKHSRDPIKGMSDWLVSHWEHGSMLLDPSDLRARYEKLEHWGGGDWINFYTETVPEALASHRSKSRSRSRSPLPSHAGTLDSERGRGATRHEPERKEIKIQFPEPRPCTPTEPPKETEAEAAEGKTGGSPSPSPSGNSPSEGNCPTIRFPEPEPFSKPSETPKGEQKPTTPKPLTVDLGSATIPRQDDKSEPPTVEDNVSPASTSSVLSLISAPIMVAMNPKGSKGSAGSRTPPRAPSSGPSSDRESSKSRPSSPFSLSRPSLNDDQKKKQDQAVNKLVKQQKKEEVQAAKMAEQAQKAAAQAEQKAAKAAAKEEEKKAKEQRNVLRKQNKAEQKEKEQLAKQEAEKEKIGPPRHFIITPPETPMTRPHWERVAVAGAASEVDAHCGIFFREKNWDYDQFVEKVAKWVQELCERKAKDALAY
ncbi:hypothetical protein FRB90_012762 [Tulasnella sp. 427]|nr:hypothetical protein FRB90_012762 [Tulasnella sp. 427]